MTATAEAAPGRHGRRKQVETVLAPLLRVSVRRTPPPDGRLDRDDYPIQRLSAALASLGPVFATFGRYLSTRLDLLPRRDCRELAAIADLGPAAAPAAIDRAIHRQLGAPPARRFMRFDAQAHRVTLWTEQHEAVIGPGLPAVVTIVRPDADEWLEVDLPLLGLVRRCVPVSPDDFAVAMDDFAMTLRARLDQKAQAAALAIVAADSRTIDGFDAPVCYPEHCAAGVLTRARLDGPTIAAVASTVGAADLTALGRRVATAWLRQALAGRVVPFDFGAHDLVVADDRRLAITGAAFEPNGSVARTRFARYLNAVAADDPDAAASWILEAGGGELVAEHEEELRRRFRQAVPFRDGESSGDDRLAEHLLVQWRVAREAGWRLMPAQLHVYRSIGAAAAIADRLAPAEDVLLGALDAARLETGLAEAAHLVDPRAIGARFDTVLQGMVGLPQKLDEVLTLAAEGRLRVRLRVPEAEGSQRVKRQTVLLVANLVLLVALVSILRHVVPAYGPAVERLGVVALLAAGGWLLVAAARM